MELGDKRVAAFLVALEALDPRIAELVRRRWQDHASRESPLLVIFGPQNTGKTRLLIRLLIDDGLAVPEWLRSGARPDDTTGRTVEWDGWQILDLPGIGSEQTRHDETAWDGVELADAVLLVISLERLTGEGLDALKLVDGSWWSADGDPLQWPAGGLHLVVARIDDGAADPEEDPEELEDLKAAIEPSIAQLLEPVGGPGNACVHWTAASPSGMLDGRSTVERRDLDRFRAWDGMDRLADTLRTSAGSVNSLRSAALIRFLHRGAKQAKLAAARELQDLGLQLQKAELVEQHRSLVDEQVNAALGNVEAQLTAVVLECFTSALDDSALGASPSVAMKEAFAARAEAFEATFLADVEILVEELRQLIQDLPDMAVDNRHEFSVNAGSPRKSRGPTLDVQGAADSLRALGNQGLELRLGSPVQEVKGKVASLKGLKGEARIEALKKAGFDSAKDADAAKRLVDRFEQASRVLEAAPQVVKLYAILSDFRRGKLEQSRAKEAAEQQDELVGDLVQQLLDDDPDGYGVRLERLRRTALKAFGDAAGAEQSLRSAMTDLERRVRTLEDALAALRD